MWTMPIHGFRINEAARVTVSEKTAVGPKSMQPNKKPWNENITNKSKSAE